LFAFQKTTTTPDERGRRIMELMNGAGIPTDPWLRRWEVTLCGMFVKPHARQLPPPAVTIGGRPVVRSFSFSPHP
jgi:hypothetical protein